MEREKKLRSTQTIMKLERASDAWLKNCIAVGRSAATVRNYRYIIEYFRNWLAESDEFASAEISFLTIQAWRNELIATKAPTTVRQYLRVLEVFFSWASEAAKGEYRYYDRNPVAASLAPDVSREQKRPYDLLLTDDLVRLLYRNKSPRDKKIKFTWPRSYAIIILMMTTGIRVSELIALRLCDVDLEAREIYVERGKGNKFRVVDFPKITETALKLYLRSGLRPAWLTENDYLFGSTGRALNAKDCEQFWSINPVPGIEWKCCTRQALYDIVERHVYAVTGVEHISPHDLRHICARVDLNSGMRLEELQSKLGHSNPVTTEIYSGRLMARRSRKSAQWIVDAQETVAEQNEEKLREAAGS